MREVDKAVELLIPLFKGLAEERKATVEVRAEKIHNDDYVIVTVNGYDYKVHVECENVRSMVKNVVDVVALKL